MACRIEKKIVELQIFHRCEKRSDRTRADEALRQVGPGVHADHAAVPSRPAVYTFSREPGWRVSIPLPATYVLQYIRLHVTVYLLPFRFARRAIAQTPAKHFKSVRHGARLVETGEGISLVFDRRQGCMSFRAAAGAIA